MNSDLQTSQAKNEKALMIDKLNGKFGFGCMRLPMKDGVVDDEQFNPMIDAFLEAGFNYFDTAHGYLDGESEKAIGRCLSARYPRSRFLLADKLTEPYFDSEEAIRPFFEKQLEICGTDYFDFYLMHAQNAENFKHFKKHKAYETAFALKEEGKIRHVGFSFHDSPDVLEEILTTYPQVEFVQLQYNYLDQEDPNVQARACYEVCEKHGKPVIVMEPVKGGTLAALPEAGLKRLAELSDASAASYALRFAAEKDNVMMVLSGMGDEAMMRDNLQTMKEPKPLNAQEQQALQDVAAIYNEAPQIGCTACKYCTAGCPVSINIPGIFKAVNRLNRYQENSARMLYKMACKDHGAPQDCIECGQCEHACPQNLPIRDLLKEAAERF